MVLRLVRGALVMILVSMPAPLSAEFNESEATTAHRQELFPTDIYRQTTVRRRKAEKQPLVDRVEGDQIPPRRIIETIGSGSIQGSSDRD